MAVEFSVYPKFDHIQKMVYTIPEISHIMNLTMNNTYRLLYTEQFPIIRAVRKKLIPIKPFHQWVEKNNLNVILPEYKETPACLVSQKKTYSVPEIRAMLGLNKVSAYEMVKNGQLESIMINKRIRVTKVSFDAWFHEHDDFLERREV